MAAGTVQFAWIYPGATVSVTTDAQDRATAILVHCPAGYTANVTLDLAKRDFSQVFPAGDTTVPVSPPRDIPDGVGFAIDLTPTG